MKWNFPNSIYWQYQKASEDLDKEFESRRNELKIWLKAQQAKCEHKHTTYFPDASGNNDSFTECDECGKEI